MKQFNSNTVYKILLVCIAIVFNTNATTFDFRGQLSGYGNTMNHDNSWDYGAGVLYIPEIDILYEVNNESFSGSDIFLINF